MSSGQLEETGEKQVALFILILSANPGRRGGWRPRPGLLGNCEGCQASPAANIRSAHLCSLNLVGCQRPHFSSAVRLRWTAAKLPRAAPPPHSCSPSAPVSLPPRLPRSPAKHAAVAMAAESGTFRKCGVSHLGIQMCLVCSC